MLWHCSLEILPVKKLGVGLSHQKLEVYQWNPIKICSFPMFSTFSQHICIFGIFPTIYYSHIQSQNLSTQSDHGQHHHCQSSHRPPTGKQKFIRTKLQLLREWESVTNGKILLTESTESSCTSTVQQLSLHLLQSFHFFLFLWIGEFYYERRPTTLQ